MAPGGPWEYFSRPECSKRWHGAPFGDISDFLLIFVQKHCASVLNRSNFCVAQRQLLCCTETKGGRAAGGRREPGGRSRQLRPHWCPPTHAKLLSPCWVGLFHAYSPCLCGHPGHIHHPCGAIRGIPHPRVIIMEVGNLPPVSAGHPLSGIGRGIDSRGTVCLYEGGAQSSCGKKSERLQQRLPWELASSWT